MARRKHLIDDGYSSDSDIASGDGDAADGDDWQGSQARKRQRRGRRGRDSEEDEDDDEEAEREARGGQAFVAASSASKPKSGSSSSEEGSDESDDDGQGIIHEETESDERDSDDDLDQDDEDVNEREARRLARAPITEEEEAETRTGFGGAHAEGPTAEEARLRSALEAPGGFRPDSFLSSRQRRTNGREDQQESQARSGLGAAERAGIGSEIGRSGSRSGIGAAGPRAGIGSHSGADAVGLAPQPVQFTASILKEAGVPTAFGAEPSVVKPSGAFQQRASEPRRPFVPSKGAGGTPALKPSGKTNGGFDPVKLMAQMGWRQGEGLGKGREGIVNPIEVQLRPERAGIAFGGRRERTKQEREEARRRGEAVSSDEDERRARRRKGGDREKRGEPSAKVEKPSKPSWLKAEKKPRAPKVEYRTYDQILEEQGALPATDAGLGQIIDATGRQPREVSDLATALAGTKAGVPSIDDRYLPELMHNLRLICETNATALAALAREGAKIRERAKWLRRERDESDRRRTRHEAEAARLSGLVSVVRELETMGKRAQASSTVTLEDFSPLVRRLEDEYEDEIAREHLDEAIVGATVGIFRRSLADWQPLEEPRRLTKTISRWRKALRIEADQGIGTSSLVHATTAPRVSKATTRQSGVMTPYESLIWNVWMPPVRSAINNEWKASRPEKAVALLEAWRPLLPRFVWDNVTDQLVMPKVKSAVAEWDPRTARHSLHHVVFPWLPLLDKRMEDMMAEAKRRIKAMLKAWTITAPKPKDLERWREMFSSGEWDSMLLNHVVPKLGAHLRKDFVVDPSAQRMEPFAAVLSWRKLLRASILSRLLEAEFFPKWLTTLHLWLTQPNASLVEVAQWYSHWRSCFPDEVAALPGIQQGFHRGQVLMNQAAEAVERGDDVSKLPKPDTTPLSRSAAAAATAAASRRRDDAGDEPEVTFRRVVEEAAAQADLLVQPANRLHAATGLPLLRISRGVDGRGGVCFYLEDDVVWLEERAPRQSGGTSSYEPVGVEELIQRVVAPS